MLNELWLKRPLSSRNVYYKLEMYHCAHTHQSLAPVSATINFAKSS
jgi:hypothetical protein